MIRGRSHNYSEFLWKFFYDPQHPSGLGTLIAGKGKGNGEEGS